MNPVVNNRIEMMESLNVKIRKIKHELDITFKELCTLQNTQCSKKTSVEEHNQFDNFLHKMLEALDEISSVYTNTYRNDSKQLLMTVRPTVPWDYQPREESLFHVLNGLSPWDFSLVNSNMIDYHNLQIRLNENLWVARRINELPNRGKIYQCVVGNETFRGMFLGIKSQLRYRFYDIDRDFEHAIERDKVFALNERDLYVPARIIRCSIMKESFGEEYWDNKLSKMFLRIMRETDFKVVIIEQISFNYPPKYLVNLTGYTKQNPGVNLSSWFNDILYPYVIKSQGYTEIIPADLNPYSGDGAALFEGKETNGETSDHSSDSEVDIPDESLKDIEDRLQLEVGTKFFGEVPSSKMCTNSARCRYGDCSTTHIGPVGPANLGYVYTDIHLKKLLNLPAVGELITIVPTTITNGLMFYANFTGPRYIAMNNCTVTNLRQKIKNLKQMINQKLPKIEPALGELVLAKSMLKKDFWFRGRVVDFDEFEVKIFDIDSGFTEMITTSTLRKLPVELLYFPALAVKCIMYNVRLKGDTNIMAMDYLKENILGKVVQAEVEVRNYNDTELEVTLFSNKGFSVNEVLKQEQIYISFCDVED